MVARTRSSAVPPSAMLVWGRDAIAVMTGRCSHKTVCSTSRRAAFDGKTCAAKRQALEVFSQAFCQLALVQVSVHRPTMRQGSSHQPLCLPSHLRLLCPSSQGDHGRRWKSGRHKRWWHRGRSGDTGPLGWKVRCCRPRQLNSQCPSSAKRAHHTAHSTPTSRHAQISARSRMTYARVHVLGFSHITAFSPSFITRKFSPSRNRGRYRHWTVCRNGRGIGTEKGEESGCGDGPFHVNGAQFVQNKVQACQNAMKTEVLHDQMSQEQARSRRSMVDG